MLYLDTSALAKLYLAEPGSAEITNMVGSYEPWLFTSVLTYAEMLSVLDRSYVDRRISRSAFSTKRREFLADWRALQLIELTEETLAPAADLIANHHLRGADAVHLCSALALNKPDFACFDTRLSAAATEQGMRVVP